MACFTKGRGGVTFVEELLAAYAGRKGGVNQDGIYTAESRVTRRACITGKSEKI